MQIKMAAPTPTSKEMPEAFPFRLYDMLEDAERKGFDHIVSWLPNGDGFRVHRFDDFVKDILPMYFNQQTRYKSFQRQLNMYEFKTLRGRGLRAKTKGPGGKEDQKGTFSHPMFFRGNRNCCRLVPRKTSGIHYTTLLHQGIASLQKNQECSENAAKAASLPTPSFEEANRRSLSLAIMQQKQQGVSGPLTAMHNLDHLQQHPSFQEVSPAPKDRIVGALDVASAPTSNILRIWAGRNNTLNSNNGDSQLLPFTPYDNSGGLMPIDHQQQDPKRYLPSLIPTVSGALDWARNTSPRDAGFLEKGSNNVAMMVQDETAQSSWYKEHEASLAKYTKEAAMLFTTSKAAAESMASNAGVVVKVEEEGTEPLPWRKDSEETVSVNEEDVVSEIISTFGGLA